MLPATTHSVVAVWRSWMNTPVDPSGTRSVAPEKKATKRPSALSEGAPPPLFP